MFDCDNGLNEADVLLILPIIFGALKSKDAIKAFELDGLHRNRIAHFSSLETAMSLIIDMNIEAGILDIFSQFWLYWNYYI